MKNTVVLTGAIASGKTSLAKCLELEGFQRIITYTTRPPRTGEIDGKDYYFITDEEFEALMYSDYFEETTHYDTVCGRCYYGSARKDYIHKGNAVIILNPRGIMSLTQDIFTVWLDIPDEILAKRALRRGNTPEEITKRMIEEAYDFRRLYCSNKYNLRFTNELPNDRLVKVILKELASR